jgi:hypothetical protein
MSRKLPIGCRDRHEAILRIAMRLKDSFNNGNKGDVLEELKKYNKVTAMAIVSCMTSYFCDDGDTSLHRYLMEVA